MRIWKKTTVILSVSVICMVLLSVLTLGYFINNDVKETELREASNLFDRINTNIESELETFGLLGYSWAYWDDTYDFVHHPNKKYIDDYLNEAALSDLNVSLIIFINEAGEDVLSYQYDTYDAILEEPSLETLEIILNEPDLQDHTVSSHIDCVMALPSGPHMITAWSIMHSDSTGPSAGTLVFGKLIDRSTEEALSLACGAPITFSNVSGPKDVSEQEAIGAMSRGSNNYILDFNQTTALCFQFIHDVNGQPVLLLATQMPRDAYLQGMSSLSMMSVIIVFFGIAILMIVLLSMNKVVISRLTRLEDDVRKIGDGGGFKRLTPLSGNDEIQSLSTEIERMVSSLDKRNRDLQESEARYKSIMEQSIGAIIIVDPQNGSILQANTAFYKMFGIEEGDLERLQLSAIRALDRPVFDRILQRILTEHHIVGAELTLHNQNGEELIIEISGGVIEYEGKEAVCITAWDVSERHRAEAAQDRIEKLEAVGNLAGGIAHDFNNLLTGILGNVSLLKKQLGPSSRAQDRLDETEVAAVRAKEIAQGLLSLSRGGDPIRQPFALNELLRSWAHFSFQGSNIECRYDIPSDIWNVFADSSQINRVFFNLFINAKDAMPNGGTMEVSAQNCDLTTTPHNDLKPGLYVLVKIKDTGNGIPPKILNKIFEPYFTTKKTGSGMGLYIVYATVKRHGGLVEVESIVGVGTTFRVYLPASDVSSTRAPLQMEATSPEHPGRARVLLMDDQDAVLGVTSEILKELGYDVGMARDGQEALDMYRRSMEEGDKYSAVIMDLTIPQGMGGGERRLNVSWRWTPRPGP